MLFSERYGYKKPPMLNRDEMPASLKTRIWNVVYLLIFSKIGDPDGQRISRTFNHLPYEFLKKLWYNFFVGDLMAFDQLDWLERVNVVKNMYDNVFKWFEVYDFIEFILNNYDDAKITAIIAEELDLVFEKENAPYRIVGNQVVSITSEEEKEEIEKALNILDKYKPVREHISKALNLFAKRPEPDYKNSIKESISAVESLVMIIEGDKKELPKLIEKLNVHPAMKDGFKKLYGWTSDACGIRHGEYPDSFPCGEPEARYMLIICSAFINYLITKLEEKNDQPV